MAGSPVGRRASFAQRRNTASDNGVFITLPPPGHLLPQPGEPAIPPSFVEVAHPTWQSGMAQPDRSMAVCPARDPERASHCIGAVQRIITYRAHREKRAGGDTNGREAKEARAQCAGAGAR